VNPVVVDASVAAKWVLPAEGETLTEEAAGWLRRYAQGEVLFLVPDLFWAETANLLWKALQHGRCSKEFAERALASLVGRGLRTIASVSLLNLAFRIATDHQRTVYDSLYVALAVRANGQLITADERLANALAAHFPVKWLGAA
jgi:predicted nucleic acid-binding protein